MNLSCHAKRAIGCIAKGSWRPNRNIESRRQEKLLLTPRHFLIVGSECTLYPLRWLIPGLHDKARAVRVSLDTRQGICYQCHAPREPETGTEAAIHSWGPQVGSGDDRTPMGVHEGLSCISCHAGHNESAAASCANCHPEMSHCGLDVEKMDTTYSNRSSAHNIHWVKCVDCHEHGVPKVKTPAKNSVQIGINPKEVARR